MPPMGSKAIPRNTVEQDNTAQSRVRNQKGQPRRGAERSCSEDSLSRPLSSSVNRTSDPPEMDDSHALVRSNPVVSTRPTRAFGRGGAAIARRRGVYQRAAAQSDDKEAMNDEDRTREDITKSKNLLSKTGQHARKYLKDLWYEDEGQMALTVRRDATNIKIFSKAADVTWNEMQRFLGGLQHAQDGPVVPDAWPVDRLVDGLVALVLLRSHHRDDLAVQILRYACPAFTKHLAAIR
ncbi:uncharacterized protein EDB91DRAFT_1084043 [Suillus paluster]|uniref:uncharacterized protein n=1 Tax=Suillus paluster TaxID=48578 RepID=UPI001B8647CD|nr:uncharacterized protein EDB91DRAFT_1084043 [Suillus paluster]KAG1734380.1 hypothetical protein EDB91DRAFT_1084043 [Suillus paluster]